jgi:tetratricopeptide (TPR) repeat protein
LDFLPALMILSVIGVFTLEQKLTGARRRIARFAWCLLLADTLAFTSLASVDGYATGDYHSGNFLIRDGRTSEAVTYLENAVSLEPGSAPFHKALGTAYQSDSLFDKAIVQYEKALAIDPTDAGSQYFLGSCFFQEGDSADAMKHLDLALKLDPACFDNYGNFGEHTAIAWSFATNADPGKRNAPLAIKLAERACQETTNQMSIVVGTLAAAYAEAGRYDDAVATAQKAIAVAEKEGDADILQRNRDFLALYLKHQPFHQGTAP